MSTVHVCDLCGKPMSLDNQGGYYKIKKHWTSWWEHGWVRIEAHDECVKRLLGALDDKRETEGATDG